MSADQIQKSRKQQQQAPQQRKQQQLAGRGGRGALARSGRGLGNLRGRGRGAVATARASRASTPNKRAATPQPPQSATPKAVAVARTIFVGGEVHVHISNLHPQVTGADLEELFKDCGAKSAHLHFDSEGQSLCTGEIIFKSISQAGSAIQKYQNVPLDEKPMHLALVGGAVPSISDRVGKTNPVTPAAKVAAAQRGGGGVPRSVVGRGRGGGLRGARGGARGGRRLVASARVRSALVPRAAGGRQRPATVGTVRTIRGAKGRKADLPGRADAAQSWRGRGSSML